jgi:hypothetical protein
MKSSNIWDAMLVVCLFLGPAVWAQGHPSGDQSASSLAPSASTAVVPQLIKFSGRLVDEQERLMTGPVGVTFALYAEQTGGASLWIETQNLTPDANGNYPAELFVAGKARLTWLRGLDLNQRPPGYEPEDPSE